MDGDDVHVEHLGHHLPARLELSGADVGVVSVDILLNSGAGMTGV